MATENSTAPYAFTTILSAYFGRAALDPLSEDDRAALNQLPHAVELLEKVFGAAVRGGYDPEIQPLYMVGNLCAAFDRLCAEMGYIPGLHDA